MSRYSKSPEERAWEAVQEKKRFYNHLGSYIIVNAFLVILNATTSYGDWWFQFPLMSWGVALAFHYIGVFGIPFVRIHDEHWESRQYERELDKYHGSSKVSDEDDPDRLDLDELRELRKEWKESDLV